jgi:hypothetical protein
MPELVSGDHFMPKGNMTREELEKLWKDWAVMEQKKRFTFSAQDCVNN